MTGIEMSAIPSEISCRFFEIIVKLIMFYFIIQNLFQKHIEAFMTVVVNGIVKGLDFGGQFVNGLAQIPVNLGLIVVNSMIPISGVVGTALSCLTGGNVERFNATASTTRNASVVLPCIFRAVIGCLNEKSFYPIDKKYPDLGYCRQLVDLFSQANDYHENISNPGNSNCTFFKKYFVTRGYYLMAAVVAVITRLADFIIGIGCVFVSFAHFGQWSDFNEFTAKNLTVLGIIDDLSRGIRGVVNPGQSFLKLEPMC